MYNYICVCVYVCVCIYNNIYAYIYHKGGEIGGQGAIAPHFFRFVNSEN